MPGDIDRLLVELLRGAVAQGDFSVRAEQEAALRDEGSGEDGDAIVPRSQINNFGVFAVEAFKWHRGIHGSTGIIFVAPLSIGIAVGSSIQIALFVAPVLVLASLLLGPKPMDLVFSLPEILAVVMAVAIAGQITSDGESHWLEGVQLLSVYVILAMGFYFLPAG